MSLNIKTPVGSRIIFANATSGYTSDQEDAKKHLELGRAYTLVNMHVDNWRTEVELKEVPGQTFNSVMFENHFQDIINRDM